MRRPPFIIVALCITLGVASFSIPSLVAGADGRESAAGKKSVQLVFPERFGSWSATGPAATAPNTLGTDALETGEAGVLERMARAYSDGKNEVSLTIARFRDPTGAYEGYTAALNPAMRPSSAGELSAVDDSKLILDIGDLLVQVTGPKNIGERDLQVLIKSLRAKADPSPLPPVRGYLPERDLVDGSQRYAEGVAGFQNAVTSIGHPEYAAMSSELGFATGAEPEIMAAQYASGSNHGALVLIQYPNPQLAEQHLRHLAGLIPGGNGGDALERKGSLLSVVVAPSSPAYGAKLRQAINYETQVTWNEPSTTATDPPITSTLVKIFIGTGVFMLIAVVLGVAFGGVRVLTKKFFPGKVFDRPEQMEVLQLGLSGKRIDPRDFY
jgi:Family of unknown function (DUF6599)